MPPSAARPNKQVFVAHMSECREPVSGAGQFIGGPTFHSKKCHIGLRGSSRALPGGQRPAIISCFSKIVKYFLYKKIKGVSAFYSQLYQFFNAYSVSSFA